jgi:hypothetical protein
MNAAETKFSRVFRVIVARYFPNCSPRKLTAEKPEDFVSAAMNPMSS